MLKLKRSTFLIFSTLFFTLLIDSCVNHDFPSYTCNEEAVSYDNTVNAIVQTKCAIENCHNGDNGADKDWTNFSLFRQRADEVKEKVITRMMPPGNSPAGPLSQEQISAIACWVDQGAQDN